MKTKIFKQNNLEQAAELLKQGELIAFPTETVYGLGAMVENETAVKKVYQAKGRPSDNPLIVHLAQAEDIYQYIDHYPVYLPQIMETFWPGPLTIVLPLKDQVFSHSVTGGLATCAFRVPASSLARELIKMTGPLVAPSANTSGRPSPTTANHVYHDLQGKIAGVLDGGSARVGVESTVIDLSDGQEIFILRPGYYGISDIKQLVDVPVKYDQHLVKESEIPKAPGMKYKHYAPKTKVLMLKDIADVDTVLAQDDLQIGLLAANQVLKCYPQIKAHYSLGDGSPREAAQNLFSGLRFLDEQHLDVILVQTFTSDDALATAYMNRLQKAANREYLSKNSL